MMHKNTNEVRNFENVLEYLTSIKAAIEGLSIFPEMSTAMEYYTKLYTFMHTHATRRLDTSNYNYTMSKLNGIVDEILDQKPADAAMEFVAKLVNAALAWRSERSMKKKCAPVTNSIAYKQTEKILNALKPLFDKMAPVSDYYMIRCLDTLRNEDLCHVDDTAQGRSVQQHILTTLKNICTHLKKAGNEPETVDKIWNIVKFRGLELHVTDK